MNGFCTTFDESFWIVSHLLNTSTTNIHRKVGRRIPVLFRKIDINWSAVDISICLHVSDWQICIF